jgi:catechol 2,3-dioxygenase-like lactoylglutathione lyase family enzyme
MSRVQLALNVSDLEASVAFYATLFGVAPHKRRPGYANFAIAEPPVKLVLIEVGEQARGQGVAGALNHLGVEVGSPEQVEAGAERLRAAGLAAFEEKDTTCCFALQDKVWVHDPSGAPWELYTIKDDDPPNPAPATGVLHDVTGAMNDGTCCTTDTSLEVSSTAAPATADTVDGGCCSPITAAPLPG